MPRDYVKELRGDTRREAIDIYNHIDMEELKRVYLETIPRLFQSGDEEKRNI
jgi:integrase/recombinase XerD